MKNNDLGQLILRLSVGLLMLPHGIAKLIGGVSAIEGMVVAKGLPSVLTYGVYIGEVIMPLLLIIGYRTRLTALAFALNCIAIIWFGGYDIFSLNAYGGWSAELPGLFLFGVLALFFTGGGKYSISNKNVWD